MRVDYEEARRILVRFSQYMRANLNTASKSLIPLTEEMDHVDAYLDIVKARFPDRLKIYRKIDDRIMDVLIPSATLQPLVENCIEHGLKNVTYTGVINIHIGQSLEGITMEVSDNGVGFPESLLTTIGKKPYSNRTGNGTALYNVNERLKGLLGDEAQLMFRNLKQGSSVSFTIPIEEY